MAWRVGWPRPSHTFLPASLFSFARNWTLQEVGNASTITTSCPFTILGDTTSKVAGMHLEGTSHALIGRWGIQQGRRRRQWPPVMVHSTARKTAQPTHVH